MSDRDTPPSCSIIVPAFNEELTIERTLKALLADADSGEFEVIVVCNGCTDETAKKAHAAAPCAIVIDLQLPSKTMALNAGIAAAQCSPVVFLDADIKASAAAVRSLVSALWYRHVDLSYGSAFLHTAESSPSVRAFYRAWGQNRYFDQGKVGGFFAVSLSGLRRLGIFPNITNDDEFVRRRLIDRSVWVEDAEYVVEAPRTLKSLMKVRSRIYRGNAQLEQTIYALGLYQKIRNASMFLGRLFLRPHLWYGAFVFLCISIIAHLRNRVFTKNHTNWEQDQSARSQCIKA